jgi:hypothetical protein
MTKSHDARLRRNEPPPAAPSDPVIGARNGRVVLMVAADVSRRHVSLLQRPDGFVRVWCRIKHGNQGFTHKQSPDQVKPWVNEALVGRLLCGPKQLAQQPPSRARLAPERNRRLADITTRDERRRVLWNVRPQRRQHARANIIYKSQCRRSLTFNQDVARVWHSLRREVTRTMAAAMRSSGVALLTTTSNPRIVSTAELRKSL